jgi:transcriptional regulator with XRE-family HTH domain
MEESGRRIREVRRRLGLTQSEFAERLKTTQSSVSRWEAGTQKPDLSSLMKIGELAGLDPIRFALYDEEHPFWTSDYGREVTVLAAIEWGHWTESLEWEDQRFLVRIPTIPSWKNLAIVGFVVRDDSADRLFPKDSVVFAAILPYTGWRPSQLGLEPSLIGYGESWGPLTVKDQDLVVVLRRSPGGLYELTLRKYQLIDDETYLTSLADNPKFATNREPPQPPPDEVPASYSGQLQIIGIVLGSFRIEASRERFESG